MPFEILYFQIYFLNRLISLPCVHHIVSTLSADQIDSLHVVFVTAVFAIFFTCIQREYEPLASGSYNTVVIARVCFVHCGTSKFYSWRPNWEHLSTFKFQLFSFDSFDDFIYTIKTK